MDVTLHINGRKINRQVGPDEMLLQTLRDLGYFSVRCGCDTTNCGLCTVWVDEEPTLSCATPSFRMEGHTITTLEGVREEADKLAAYIAAEGADQCGYCTTGMMMSAIALKKKNPHPTDDEIKTALVGNLCRCTGYEGQLRALRNYMEGR